MQAKNLWTNFMFSVLSFSCQKLITAIFIPFVDVQVTHNPTNISKAHVNDESPQMRPPVQSLYDLKLHYYLESFNDKCKETILKADI